MEKSIRDLLNEARTLSVASVQHAFYANDAEFFFDEFTKNVIGKIRDEVTTETISRLTEPDGSAILMMLKRFGDERFQSFKNIDEFNVRYAQCLSAIKTVFSGHHPQMARR